ncbi:GTPase-activating protein [Pseudoloma neurophilia]|uniref:GTPase-activating protein n=1 Tax=Pseudoloma neurophilia TaxID=146866 RepID=A0A0R0M3T9_9MICR|nr:GTPase-activating protein [Pseudoloma neurophilia]
MSDVQSSKDTSSQKYTNDSKYIESTTEYKIFKHIQSQLDITNFTPRNIYELKNFCYYGYNNNLLRAKFWKLFLNYLPTNKFKTEHHLKERRKLYHFYLEKSLIKLEENPMLNDTIEKDVARMCVRPVNDVSDEEQNEKLVHENEDKENPKPDNYNQEGKPFEQEGKPFEEEGKPFEEEGKPFEEEGKPFEEEGKPFEQEGKPFEQEGNIESQTEKPQTVPIKMNKKCEFLDADHTVIHRNALKRILLTFKVTNSGIGYVQGMHMVLLPIYYVFATSDNIEDKKYAEEDAFFCFFNLLTEVGENFLKEYDNDSKVGINKKMSEIFTIIKKHDKGLHKKLEELGLIETHFCFKWISLLLSGEFDIDQIIILWDKLFSDQYRYEILIYCCASIIILMKKAIMECSFEECLKILQGDKKIDVLTVFTLADKLRKEQNK